MPVDSQLVACEDIGSLAGWADRSAVTASRPVDSLEPPDPETVGGLELYRRLLEGPARVTRSHIDFWPEAPPYDAAERAYFQANPEVWNATTKVRAAKGGSRREAALRGAIARFRNDPVALRHIVLRDQTLFFDDAVTAKYAARVLRPQILFTEPELELERAGVQVRLLRNVGGYYVYADGPEAGEVANIFMFDRIAPAGQLHRSSSLGLQSLRRHLALERVEIQEERQGWYDAEVELFTGDILDGAVVSSAEGTWLGVVGDVTHVRDQLSASRDAKQPVDRLISTIDTMVRERIEFDEPPNEIGQQDGTMRWRFDRAMAAGEDTYVINGVRKKVYDSLGRPMPPQLCIDFLTDAVERSSGYWWPLHEGQRARTPAAIVMRDYMQFRTVRSLIALARSHPAASLVSFSEEERTPFEQRDAFFDFVFRNRGVFRRGDAALIYGLRPDNRNHYHSFYVHDTDPVFGVPIVLSDNAGITRTRTWTEIMSESPKRSVWYRVRFNPDWLRDPRPVDTAAGVLTTARSLL